MLLVNARPTVCFPKDSQGALLVLISKSCQIQRQVMFLNESWRSAYSKVEGENKDLSGEKREMVGQQEALTNTSLFQNKLQNKRVTVGLFHFPRPACALPSVAQLT